MSSSLDLSYLGFLTLNAKCLSEFHDLALLMVVMVMIFVSFSIHSSWVLTYISKHLLSDESLEVTWTIMPALILVLLGIPSLTILYLLEDLTESAYSVKILGNQWFWEYENSQFSVQNEAFSSYMVTKSENWKKSNFRLLESSSSLWLPANILVRGLISSVDVLHSWTVPAMGVKADACPGRLNEILLCPLYTGVYYGQCSEICGTNHSFMPICVKVLNPLTWLK